MSLNSSSGSCNLYISQDRTRCTSCSNCVRRADCKSTVLARIGFCGCHRSQTRTGRRSPSPWPFRIQRSIHHTASESSTRFHRTCQVAIVGPNCIHLLHPVPAYRVSTNNPSLKRCTSPMARRHSPFPVEAARMTFYRERPLNPGKARSLLLQRTGPSRPYWRNIILQEHTEKESTKATWLTLLSHFRERKVWKLEVSQVVISK